MYETPPQPFTQGINVIVIPNQIFINTKLNSKIQLAYNDEGEFVEANLPHSLRGADLSGVDRDEGETISEHVESLISHIVIRSDYLLEILNLLLEDPEGYVVHSYSSTDHDADLTPETIGLPEDVLELIPFSWPFINGPTSDHQPSFWKVWNAIVNFFTELGRLIWGAIVALANFLISLVQLIIDWGMKVIQAIGEAVMQAVEAILKAIMLLVILIEFVFNLIITLLIVLLLGIFLIAASGGNGSYGGLWAEATLNGNLIRLEASVYWTYHDFIELNVPALDLLITINGDELTRLNFGGADTNCECPIEDVEVPDESETSQSDTNYPADDGNPNLSTESFNIMCNGNGYEPVLRNRVISPDPLNIDFPKTESLYFSIEYSDQDGHAPSNGNPKIHFVSIVDSTTSTVPLQMDMTDTDPYQDGVTYEISGIASTLGLKEGHTYYHYFTAEDTSGETTILDNQGSNYIGPIIYGPMMEIVDPEDSYVKGLGNDKYDFEILL